MALQIFVQHLGFGQFHWELLFAASVLVTLPMIIIFFLAQKQFIEGNRDDRDQGVTASH